MTRLRPRQVRPLGEAQSSGGILVQTKATCDQSLKRLFSMKLGSGVLWGSIAEVGALPVLVVVRWSKSREALGGSG